MIRLFGLERWKLRSDAPNAYRILNTAHKVNAQLLVTEAHNTNTTRHSRKLAGNSTKQIKGCIFKEQVVTAATRAAEADSKSRMGWDKIRDNESKCQRKARAEVYCTNTLRRQRGRWGARASGQAACGPHSPCWAHGPSYTDSRTEPGQHKSDYLPSSEEVRQCLTLLHTEK